MCLVCTGRLSGEPDWAIGCTSICNQKIHMKPLTKRRPKYPTHFYATGTEWWSNNEPPVDSRRCPGVQCDGIINNINTVCLQCESLSSQWPQSPPPPSSLLSLSPLPLAGPGWRHSAQAARAHLRLASSFNSARERTLVAMTDSLATSRKTWDQL